jgi:glycosyltransferase involved in cell wall biosynthesis
MKVLIVAPELHRLGGVANHYLGLNGHWDFAIDYSFYGKRKDNTSKLLTAILYPYNFFQYIGKLLFKRPDVVIVNPSLRVFQLIRDGLYLLFAKLLGIQVVTFIHGSDLVLSDKLAHQKGLFQFVYNKSSFIYVLFSDFKYRLERAGIRVPILLTTTKVSDALIENYSFQTRTQVRTLLFVARIVRDKGIFETIDTFRILKTRFPYLKLIVAGDGIELAEVQNYTEAQCVADVEFVGNVTGKELAECYAKGDVYILPTREEGMATSVLEAMAFGLPIISAPVGGILDFFENGIDGYLIDGYAPADYAAAVSRLIESPAIIKAMSEHNYNYAKKHFMASSVVVKIQSDIVQYCNK